MMVVNVSRTVSRISGLSFWFSRNRPMPQFTITFSTLGNWWRFTRPNSARVLVETSSL